MAHRAAGEEEEARAALEEAVSLDPDLKERFHPAKDVRQDASGPGKSESAR